MDKDKVLYAITVEDVIDFAEENDLKFKEKDLNFIEEKIGDFLGSIWYDAIDSALAELKSSKKVPKLRP